MTSWFRWVVLILCVCPTQLVGDTILYNNLGPGNTYTNFSLAAYQTYIATTFTTTSSGNLGSILIAGTLWLGSSPVTMGLYTDSSGEPGQLLESWDVSLPTSRYPPVTTIQSVSSPFLDSGTQYWFVVTQTTGHIEFYSNSQGVDGGYWAGDSIDALFDSGSFFQSPAIQLNAATPEPASGVLLGLGCLVLMTVRGLLFGSGTLIRRLAHP